MTPTRIALVLALAIGFAACGDDDDDDDAPAPGPQTPPNVTLYLHDAPANVRRLSAFLQSIQVHVTNDPTSEVTAPEDASMDGSDKWRTLPVEETFDLVAAPNADEAYGLGTMPLPTGKITQIRLQFDRTQPMRVVFAGDGGCLIDLSTLPETGLKITRPFKTLAANPNDNLELWVDFDLDASLVPTADCFELRPVLKISRARNNGQELPLN